MALSVKGKFTKEEWGALLRAPMLAGYAVAGASPSDEEGFVREMAAVADVIAEGAESAAPGSLLAEVTKEIVANAHDEHRGPTERIEVGEIKERALANCREVATLLAGKASADEVTAYKQWVLDATYRVAMAAKEGGLFGFGGQQVSEGERTTIDELAVALGARGAV